MSRVGVFIGRFGPLRHVQLRMIKEALSRVDALVIVIGSHEQARTIRTPWTSTERREMISACLTADELTRTSFVLVRDHLYNDNRWVSDLQQGVRGIDAVAAAEHVMLFTSEHDEHDGYANLFPKWELVKLAEWEKPTGTYVRMLYFTRDVTWRELVPGPVAERMLAFEALPAFKDLNDEFHHIDEYRRSWDGAPFPPTFVTVDAVAVCSGHVLVVRRRGRPGKGLIALPGGFVNQREKIRDAAVRELKEETSIRLNRDELDKLIIDERVFDHPDRSLRGRTITHAFCIDLGSGELPKVRGDDDADKAWWMPLGEVSTRTAEFFEDHAHIIEHMTSKF